MYTFDKCILLNYIMILELKMHTIIIYYYVCECMQCSAQ